MTATLGLPIGGLLVGAWGWRTTFLVNVPFAALAFLLATVWIPRDQPVERSGSPSELAARLDIVGMAGFAGTIAALLVFLLSFPAPDWIALGVAIVLGGSLVLWELRASHPFFDVRLLARNLPLTRTYLRWAIGGLCVYTVLYGVTQWLEAGRGISSREAGLLLPMSIMSALVVRQVSKRNLVRVPLIVSAVSCVAASADVLLLTTSSPVIWIIVITLVFGITLGTSASGNQITLYSQVPPAQIGTAAGLFRTWGYIGSIASSAIISMVFRTSVTDHGLHVIALVMIAVSTIALLITIATLGRANALIVAPEWVVTMNEGDEADVLILP